MFMKVVDFHIPIRQKNLRKKVCPWISRDIVHLMKERDKMHKAAVKSNDTELWSAYRSLRNRVTRSIRKQKSAYYRGILCDNRGNSKKIWNCINEVISKGKPTLPHSVHHEGQNCD
jgi:hypothetical protein